MWPGIPKWPKITTLPEDILDLYCIQLLNTPPFCENYAKLYVDVKQEGEWKGRNLWDLFSKKVSFLANIERCHKFLQYAVFAISLQYFKILFKSILWFWLVWSGIPKVLKIASLQCLYNISDKKLKMSLMFCMQINMKVNFNT